MTHIISFSEVIEVEVVADNQQISWSSRKAPDIDNIMMEYRKHSD